MKILINILLVLFLSSCSVSQRNTLAPKKLKIDSIDHVYLKFGKDSMELSQEQIDLFVNKWNNSKPKGLCKMIPNFWLTVHLKNGLIREFRANRDLIKEEGDSTFTIGDSKMINSFWTSTH